MNGGLKDVMYLMKHLSRNYIGAVKWCLAERLPADAKMTGCFHFGLGEVDVIESLSLNREIN